MDGGELSLDIAPDGAQFGERESREVFGHVETLRRGEKTGG